MKRRQVFVRGRRADGTVGNIDVLDLDDDSFRAFILDRLDRGGLVAAIKEEHAKGDVIELRERNSSILPEGMKYERLDISSEDARWLETRRVRVAEGVADVADDLLPRADFDTFVQRGRAAQVAVDDALLAAALAELAEREAPITLVIRPAWAFHLAALVQLAVRQPGLRATDAQVRSAVWFLEHMRGYFADAPAVLSLIRRGDEPSER